MALRIAVPLLFMLVLFTVLAFLFLRLSLSSFTRSLNLLTLEASYISKGQLDRSLELKGVDEVGRLSQVFEQMRRSLAFLSVRQSVKRPKQFLYGLCHRVALHVSIPDLYPSVSEGRGTGPTT